MVTRIFLVSVTGPCSLITPIHVFAVPSNCEKSGSTLLSLSIVCVHRVDAAIPKARSLPRLFSLHSRIHVQACRKPEGFIAYPPECLASTNPLILHALCLDVREIFKG